MKKILTPDFPTSTLSHKRPSTASIIIDNYNYGEFVGNAIESALAQTHPAQVIVVDDGSTDESRKVIQSFEKDIETIFKANGGQASALNAGFAKAIGDLIFFLDADDMLEPNAVADVLKHWHVGTVMAHYLMTMIDSHNIPIGFIPDPAAKLADGDVRSELLAKGSFASTLMSGMAFSRMALNSVLPMPEGEFAYAADGYLLRAVAFLGPVQFINLPLARYRFHEKNDSNPILSNGAIGFRKKIRYSQNEFETTRKFAEKYNLPVASNLGEHDADFLGYRLFSLLLDPTHHPIAGDRRFNLLFRYIRARWTSSWSLRRRLMAIVLSIAAVIVKRSTARDLVWWLHDAKSQPMWFRNLADRLRRKAHAHSNVSSAIERQEGLT